jgi:hypothetical protein
MADLTGIEAAQSVKIMGSDADGTEQLPVKSTVDDEGNNRLLVDSKLDSGELVPTITNKFRIRSNVGDVNIDTNYTSLFSRNGEGLFFGFQTAFNSDEIVIKLTLDTAIVFELTLDEIRSFQFNDTSTGRTQMGGFLTTIGNVLDFSSKFAIPYETDLDISVKTTTGNKKNTNWIVFLTEDA